jgi:hypothetical protein
MRRFTLLLTVVSLVFFAQGTAAADHDVPPGERLVEFPFALTCDGVTGVVTVTAGELRTGAALGPGWSTEFGLLIPRSLTIVDSGGNVVFVLTNGKKLAEGLESMTCTGLAVLPDDSFGEAVFEMVVLP